MGRKNQSAERRVEIVSAFARVLANHGYAGATITAIADEANLSPGLLHHHFKNKQEILEELLETMVKRFKEAHADRIINDGNNAVEAYLNTSLKLDSKSDHIAAKCWVSIFSEGLRDPTFFEKIKRYLDSEINNLVKISNDTLSSKDASSILSFIIGSLVFGAYAPKRTKGFALNSSKKLLDILTANAL